LDVIGAGWGRTGTTSTMLALTILGYRCHHMNEVDDNPGQERLFLEATRDPSFDWDLVFGTYTATVDWPGSAFWRELLLAYPGAKVLLNVRDFDGWYESWRATIYQTLAHVVPGDRRPTWRAMADAVITHRSLGGELHNRAHVRRAFHAHIQAVTGTVPRERLLVYDVRQGWRPLCGFLGKEVPDVAFPHANVRDEWGAVGGSAASRDAQG